MSAIIRPIITEKSMQQTPDGRYTFEVTPESNKITIAKEIHETYKVDAAKIRIIYHHGKTKKFRQIEGRQSDRKKAIVTLKSGQKISGFEMGK